MCGIAFTGCVSTTRYNSRDGYTPTAIVLRGISASKETYLSWVQRTLADPSHATDIPKATHYYLDADGNVLQLLNNSDNAKSFDNFTGVTWPLFDSVAGNKQFVSIGIPTTSLSTPARTALVELVCCIIAEYLPTLELTDQHILVDHDITSSGLITELPENFIEGVSTCLTERGLTPVPNLGDLVECCAENTNAIESLIERVVALEELTEPIPGQISTHTTQITELQEQVAALQEQVAAMQAVIDSQQTSINSIINTLLEHAECIAKVCPEPDGCLPIHYTLLPGEQVFVPYAVATRINFTHKISDTVPPSVFPGPMWTTHLTCECNWSITASVTFASSDWCQGGRAKLIVVACGVQYVLQDRLINSSGPQTISLSGSIGIGVPPECSDIHVAVLVNDDTTPAKLVIAGEVEMECL